VKAFARLAVLILLAPALLLAQTSTGQSTAGSKTNDNKPAYAQTPTDAQDSAAPAAAAPAADNAAANAAPAKPNVPLAYPIMSDKSKQRARQLYEYFVHGQDGLLYASFTPGMKKQATEAKISTISKQVTEKLGTPGETLSESFLPGLGAPVTIYNRTTRYSKVKVPVMVVMVLNGAGELADFQVQPVQYPRRDEYSDYQDSTKLRLPFNGSWVVIQGGRAMYDNSYAASDDNRYSVSFAYVKDGMTYQNNGRQNSDYFCYGQPVLAPAAGVVVQSAGNSADHAPGRVPEVQSRGNYVVIGHGNSEYSLLPYLKAGSLKVRPGQHVKQGDVVGECGNSGSSFAPHVEYSLQNTRGFPLPKTMPAQFVNYTADGKAVAIGEPLRGQMISNGPATPPVETAAKP